MRLGIKISKEILYCTIYLLKWKDWDVKIGSRKLFPLVFQHSRSLYLISQSTHTHQDIAFLLDDFILTNQSYVSLAVDVFIFKACLEIMKVKLIWISNRSGLANGLVFESFLTWRYTPDHHHVTHNYYIMTCLCEHRE